MQHNNSGRDRIATSRRISLTLAALALFAPASIALTTTDAAALAKHYSSCDQLTKDFPYGVAKSRSAAQSQVKQGNHRPAFGPKARSVYRENHASLDRDNDGTACES